MVINKDIPNKPRVKNIMKLKLNNTTYNRCTGHYYYKDIIVKLKKQSLSEDKQTVLTNEEIRVVKVLRYKKPSLRTQMKWLSKKSDMYWKDSIL